LVPRRDDFNREACMQPPSQPAPHAQTPAQPARARILIADDNPQGVELLEAYLSDAEYDIRTAADGEETLHVIGTWHPDLILLDIMMPKISGFEVCKRLRANPATRDIGVIMITALDDPSDIERAVEAGTNDFVTKPIEKSVLLLRVRSLLQSRQYKLELEQALAYIEAVERGGP
jgi:two-component system, OmpR family, alkaline phosphatase synthesis response regulator PhoP